MTYGEGKDNQVITAHAYDPGLKFILRPMTDDPPENKAGLRRREKEGHVVTIVGRGGTGKSILALQMLNQLLTDAKEDYANDGWPEDRRHAAFYFTLEASPYELYNQVNSFKWPSYDNKGKVAKRKGVFIKKDDVAVNVSQWDKNGLYVVSVPSPAADLSALVYQIRQTVARKLHEINRLVAIVIDPVGAIVPSDDLLTKLGLIKELADSHRTFVFMLTEEHIFETYRSIEHYSQSIFHLHHTSGQDGPTRTFSIQKTRTQVFYSGRHQMQLRKTEGIRIIPSMQSQSSYAHEMLELRNKEKDTEKGKKKIESSSFLLGHFPGSQKVAGIVPEIESGSVVFLMGPPGTFKQHITTRFAITTKPKRGKKTECCIYISFKADKVAVERSLGIGSEDKSAGINRVIDLQGQVDQRASPHIHFLDARSPLKTPAEVLTQVREEIIDGNPNCKYSRAIVWGLRRLNDMPNFQDGKDVRFLEALVTLLASRGITTLLVDWPDVDRASTLPIVDLSQYIFLTRVCKGPHSSQESLPPEAKKELWGTIRQRAKNSIVHVSLLSIQRTPEGFYRGKGVKLARHASTNPLKGTEVRMNPLPDKLFEWFWHRTGNQWEEDPSLIQGGAKDYQKTYPGSNESGSRSEEEENG